MHLRNCVSAASFIFASVIMEILAKSMSIKFVKNEMTAMAINKHINSFDNDSTISLQPALQEDTLSKLNTAHKGIHKQIDTDLTKSQPFNGGRTGERTVNSVQQTPEYMLELYHKFSTRASQHHESNIIRSFKNIHKTEPTQIETKSSVKAGFRSHSLTFDISTIDRKERIASAELRLFTLIQKDQRSFHGVSRIVSIYEILGKVTNVSSKHNSKKFLISKYIYTSKNAWESFDVTAALKRSLKLLSKREHFEIRIQSFMASLPNDDMDINANHDDVKQPLLVVYSDDTSPQHERTKDRHELLLHELESNVDSAFKLATQAQERPSDLYTMNQSDEVLSRSKRSRQGRRGRGYHRSSACKRRPMYMNFEDINWQTWIIAPRGYQAYQCAGRCYFPLSEHLTPSKHAIIQTLLHANHPKRAARACCVPTKLGPISILYIDEQGVVTYKYRYEGMVVTECGCR